MAQIAVTLEEIQHRSQRKHKYDTAISTTIGIGESYTITPNGTGSTLLDTLSDTEYTVSESVTVLSAIIAEASSGGNVDTNNSSSTILGIDEEFTGAATEILDYAIIFVTTHSDVASATDGLHVEMSSDGTTWRESAADVFSISADTEKTFSFQF